MTIVRLTTSTNQTILRRQTALGRSRMSKYTEDKERIDKITELIANQEPVKEWVCIYWMAVAIGHLLEWVVKNEKYVG